MSETLADMTKEERNECVGMWCVDGEGLLCIYTGEELGLGAGVYPEHRLVMRSFFDELTPRPDLPRAWTVDGQPPAGEWEHINEPRFQNHKRRFVGEWEEE